MLMRDIIRRNAVKFPNKKALIYGDQSTTYYEFNQRVNRLGNSLLQLGIKKGDRLAAILHNGPEFFELYFASAKIGSIFVPVPNTLKQKELVDILKYLTPRFLVTDPDFEKLIGPISSQTDFIEIFIGLEGCSSGNFKEYESLVNQGDPKEPQVSISEDDVMNIFLTSGTTGKPKGVMRTHKCNFLGSMTEAIEMKLEYDDRAVYLFPVYHAAFESAALRHILMANSILIRREGGFNAKEVLATLSKEKITVCQFVPTMINVLLQEEDIEDYDLSHLRLIVYAASPMPEALLKRAMRKFNCKFVQMYGQTESAPLITLLRPEDHVLQGTQAELARLVSAGRPVLNYEVKIVDAADKEIAVGDVGEIVARGEAMPIGYWGLPEETERTYKDGWLHTGDVGRIDEEGYVFIVDRKKDMIISGGKNIYPREIEEVLYRHNAILEATVIGVPDEHWGEAVKAIVVLIEGFKTTEDEIITFCGENLAGYKKPKTVEFKKELPKNPAGKILKKEIKNEYWKGRDRGV